MRAMLTVAVNIALLRDVARSSPR